jgi:hypothetical protein
MNHDPDFIAIWITLVACAIMGGVVFGVAISLILVRSM